MQKRTYALYRTDDCKKCIFMNLTKPEIAKAILLDEPLKFSCNKRKKKISNQY